MHHLHRPPRSAPSPFIRVILTPISRVISIKVPITPKKCFRLIKFLYRIGKNAAKFLNSVKTRINYEFLKLALLTARPSIRENGTSDVIPGHCQRRSSNSHVVLCVG